jgi:hypothetical protein
MEQPPPRLDYQSPPQFPSGERPGSWGGFMLGLFGGLAVSLVYYLSLGTNVAQHSPAAPFGAVLLKITVGIALLFSPQWKRVGLGLICSIPLAILIFLGLCFGLIAMN